METARSQQVELMKVRLGRALAATRNSRGWSQAHVAQKLGIDSETISRIERGHVIRLDRLLDLALVYEVPVSSLFNDAPGPKPSTAEEIALLVSLLDEGNQRWVLEMVRAIIAKLER
jgi:transcriptional regulator with XRE-family HTH domain